MITKTFDQKGDFEAMHAAEQYCKENGISVGSMARDLPIGLMYGDYQIAKWHNLSRDEKKQLHGKITGDKRNGPIYLEIDETKNAV